MAAHGENPMTTVTKAGPNARLGWCQSLRSTGAIAATSSTGLAAAKDLWSRVGTRLANAIGAPFVKRVKSVSSAP
jgi:hypothetical protein